MKSMIDIDQENRKIKRKLIYDVLIPEKIGQLDPAILFDLVKKYTENPSLDTIKKFKSITEFEKKAIIKILKEDKEFKEHRNQCDKLKRTALMKKI